MSETDAFLCSASRLLNSTLSPSLSASILQTHLLAKWSRRCKDESPVNLITCKFCNSVLKHSCQLKILPKKVLRKNMKKLVRRVEMSSKLYVSKLQMSLMKKFNKNKGNKLALTCSMCHKRNIRLLEKPEKEKKICLDVPVDVHPAKKKKKKDRLAGLKASAVLAANASGIELERLLLKKEKKKKKLESELSSGFVSSKSVSAPLTVSVTELTTAVVKPVRPPVLARSNAATNLLSLSTKRKKNLKSKKVADAPDVSVANVKKFKKGNKLTEMLAAAETAKLVQKKKPKNSLLASLELMLH